MTDRLARWVRFLPVILLVVFSGAMFLVVGQLRRQEQIADTRSQAAESRQTCLNRCNKIGSAKERNSCKADCPQPPPDPNITPQAPSKEKQPDSYKCTCAGGYVTATEMRRVGASGCADYCGKTTTPTPKKEEKTEKPVTTVTPPPGGGCDGFPEGTVAIGGEAYGPTDNREVVRMCDYDPERGYSVWKQCPGCAPTIIPQDSVDTGKYTLRAQKYDDTLDAYQQSLTTCLARGDKSDKQCEEEAVQANPTVDDTLRGQREIGEISKTIPQIKENIKDYIAHQQAADSAVADYLAAEQAYETCLKEHGGTSASCVSLEKKADELQKKADAALTAAGYDTDKERQERYASAKEFSQVLDEYLQKEAEFAECTVNAARSGNLGRPGICLSESNAVAEVLKKATGLSEEEKQQIRSIGFSSYEAAKVSIQTDEEIAKNVRICKDAKSCDVDKAVTAYLQTDYVGLDKKQAEEVVKQRRAAPPPLTPEEQEIIETAQENVTEQVAIAKPESCGFLNWCEKGYSCINHICVAKAGTPQKTETLTGAALTQVTVEVAEKQKQCTNWQPGALYRRDIDSCVYDAPQSKLPQVLPLTKISEPQISIPGTGLKFCPSANEAYDTDVGGCVATKPVQLAVGECRSLAGITIGNECAPGYRCPRMASPLVSRTCVPDVPGQNFFKEALIDATWLGSPEGNLATALTANGPVSQNVQNWYANQCADTTDTDGICGSSVYKPIRAQDGRYYSQKNISLVPEIYENARIQSAFALGEGKYVDTETWTFDEEAAKKDGVLTKIDEAAKEFVAQNISNNGGSGTAKVTEYAIDFSWVAQYYEDNNITITPDKMLSFDTSSTWWMNGWLNDTSIEQQRNNIIGIGTNSLATQYRYLGIDITKTKATEITDETTQKLLEAANEAVFSYNKEMEGSWWYRNGQGVQNAIAFGVGVVTAPFSLAVQIPAQLAVDIGTSILVDATQVTASERFRDTVKELAKTDKDVENVASSVTQSINSAKLVEYGTYLVSDIGLNIAGEWVGSAFLRGNLAKSLIPETEIAKGISKGLVTDSFDDAARLLAAARDSAHIWGIDSAGKRVLVSDLAGTSFAKYVIVDSASQAEAKQLVEAGLRAADPGLLNFKRFTQNFDQREAVKVISEGLDPTAKAAFDASPVVTNLLNEKPLAERIVDSVTGRNKLREVALDTSKSPVVIRPGDSIVDASGKETRMPMPGEGKIIRIIDENKNVVFAGKPTEGLEMKIGSNYRVQILNESSLSRIYGEGQKLVNFPTDSLQAVAVRGVDLPGGKVVATGPTLGERVGNFLTGLVVPNRAVQPQKEALQLTDLFDRLKTVGKKGSLEVVDSSGKVVDTFAFDPASPHTDAAVIANTFFDAKGASIRFRPESGRAIRFIAETAGSPRFVEQVTLGNRIADSVSTAWQNISSTTKNWWSDTVARLRQPAKPKPVKSSELAAFREDFGKAGRAEYDADGLVRIQVGDAKVKKTANVFERKANEVIVKYDPIMRKAKKLNDIDHIVLADGSTIVKPSGQSADDFAKSIAEDRLIDPAKYEGAKVFEIDRRTGQVSADPKQFFSWRNTQDRPQARFIVDSVLQPGTKILEGGAGLGKSDVIIQSVAYLKQSMTGKKITVIFKDAKDLENFRAIFTNDAAASLGFKPFVLSTTPPSAAQVGAMKSANMFIGTSDAIFNSLEKEGTVKELIDAMRGSILIADEAHVSMRLDIPYIKSIGETIFIPKTQSNAFSQLFNPDDGVLGWMTRQQKDAFSAGRTSGLVEQVREVRDGVEVLGEPRFTDSVRTRAYRDMITRRASEFPDIPELSQLAAKSDSELEEALRAFRNIDPTGNPRLATAVKAVRDDIASFNAAQKVFAEIPGNNYGFGEKMIVEVDASGKPVSREIEAVVPSDNTVPTGRQYSQEHQEMAYQYLGRIFLEPQKPPPNIADLTLSVTGDAIETNYARFFKETFDLDESVMMSATTGKIATQWEKRFGIPTIVYSAPDALPGGKVITRFVATQTPDAIGRLASVTDVGSNQARKYVNGARGSKNDLILAQQRAASNGSGRDLAAWRGDGTGVLYRTDGSEEPIADLAEINRLQIEYAQRGKVLDVSYTLGTNYGTDLDSLPTDRFITFFDNDSDWTDFIQTIGRDRCKLGCGELHVVYFGKDASFTEADAIASFKFNEARAQRAINLSDIDSEAKDAGYRFIAELEKRNGNRGITDIFKPKQNPNVFDELRAKWRTVAGPDLSIGTEAVDIKDHIAEQANRLQGFINELNQNVSFRGVLSRDAQEYLADASRADLFTTADFTLNGTTLTPLSSSGTAKEYVAAINNSYKPTDFEPFIIRGDTGADTVAVLRTLETQQAAIRRTETVVTAAQLATERGQRDAVALAKTVAAQAAKGAILTNTQRTTLISGIVAANKLLNEAVLDETEKEVVRGDLINLEVVHRDDVLNRISRDFPGVSRNDPVVSKIAEFEKKAVELAITKGATFEEIRTQLTKEYGEAVASLEYIGEQEDRDFTYEQAENILRSTISGPVIAEAATRAPIAQKTIAGRIAESWGKRAQKIAEDCGFADATKNPPYGGFGDSGMAGRMDLSSTESVANKNPIVKGSGPEGNRTPGIRLEKSIPNHSGPTPFFSIAYASDGQVLAAQSTSLGCRFARVFTVPALRTGSRIARGIAQRQEARLKARIAQKEKPVEEPKQQKQLTESQDLWRKLVSGVIKKLDPRGASWIGQAGKLADLQLDRFVNWMYRNTLIRAARVITFTLDRAVRIVTWPARNLFTIPEPTKWAETQSLKARAATARREMNPWTSWLLPVLSKKQEEALRPIGRELSEIAKTRKIIAGRVKQLERTLGKEAPSLNPDGKLTDLGRSRGALAKVGSQILSLERKSADILGNTFGSSVIEFFGGIPGFINRKVTAPIRSFATGLSVNLTDADTSLGSYQQELETRRKQLIGETEDVRLAMSSLDRPGLFGGFDALWAAIVDPDHLIRKQQRALVRQQKKLEKDIADKTREQTETKAKRDEVEKRVVDLEKRLEELGAQLAVVESSVGITEEEIDRLERLIQEESEKGVTANDEQISQWVAELQQQRQAVVPTKQEQRDQETYIQLLIEHENAVVQRKMLRGQVQRLGREFNVLQKELKNLTNRIIPTVPRPSLGQTIGKLAAFIGVDNQYRSEVGLWAKRLLGYYAGTIFDPFADTVATIRRDLSEARTKAAEDDHKAAGWWYKQREIEVEQAKERVKALEKELSDLKRELTAGRREAWQREIETLRKEISELELKITPIVGDIDTDVEIASYLASVQKEVKEERLERIEGYLRGAERLDRWATYVDPIRLLVRSDLAVARAEERQATRAFNQAKETLTSREATYGELKKLSDALQSREVAVVLELPNPPGWPKVLLSMAARFNPEINKVLVQYNQISLLNSRIPAGLVDRVRAQNLAKDDAISNAIQTELNTIKHDDIDAALFADWLRSKTVELSAKIKPSAPPVIPVMPPPAPAPAELVSEPQWRTRVLQGLSQKDQQVVARLRDFFTKKGVPQRWYYAGAGYDVSPVFIAPTDTEHVFVDRSYDKNDVVWGYTLGKRRSELTNPFMQRGGYVSIAKPWRQALSENRQTITIDNRTSIQLVGGDTNDLSIQTGESDAIYTNALSPSPGPDVLISLKTGGYYVTRDDTVLVYDQKVNLENLGFRKILTERVDSWGYEKNVVYTVYEKTRAFTPEEEDALRLYAYIFDVEHHLSNFIYTIHRERFSIADIRAYEQLLRTYFERFFSVRKSLRGDSESLDQELVGELDQIFADDAFPNRVRNFFAAKTTGILLDDAQAKQYYDQAKQMYLQAKGVFILPPPVGPAQPPEAKQAEPKTPQPVPLQPAAGLVIPECVTGDTLLKRRKKKKGKLTDEWEDVPIREIQAGDEILSLDEKTGAFVPQTVEKLLKKGVQNIWGIKTSGGKYIKTTAVHPYLVQTALPKHVSGIFDVDISGRIEELNKDSYLAIANTQASYTIRIPAKTKRLLKLIHQKNHTTKFGFQIYAHLIRQVLMFSEFEVGELRIHHDYQGNEHQIEHIIRAVYPNVSMYFVSVGKGSPADSAAYRARTQGIGIDKTVTLDDYEMYKKETLATLKGVADATDHREWIPGSPSHRVSTKVYGRMTRLSMGVTRWTRASELRTGDKIATMDGWEFVVGIERKGRMRVYDIQIAGTHNFVGNGIVAHNTSFVQTITGMDKATSILGFGTRGRQLFQAAWRIGLSRNRSTLVRSGITVVVPKDKQEGTASINGKERLVRVYQRPSLLNVGIFGSAVWPDGISAAVILDASGKETDDFFWIETKNIKPQQSTVRDLVVIDTTGGIPRKLYRLDALKNVPSVKADLQIEQRLFDLGKAKKLTAHGVEEEKGGMQNFFSIMVDGLRGKEGGLFVGPLIQGQADIAVGPHGPYYIVLSDTTIQTEGSIEVIPTSQHSAYLVPSNAEKTRLVSAIAEARQKGVITEEERQLMISKIYTYQEFISANPLTASEQQELQVLQKQADEAERRREKAVENEFDAAGRAIQYVDFIVNNAYLTANGIVQSRAILDDLYVLLNIEGSGATLRYFLTLSNNGTKEITMRINGKTITLAFGQSTQINLGDAAEYEGSKIIFDNVDYTKGYVRAKFIFENTSQTYTLQTLPGGLQKGDVVKYRGSDKREYSLTIDDPDSYSYGYIDPDLQKFSSGGRATNFSSAARRAQGPVFLIPPSLRGGIRQSDDHTRLRRLNPNLIDLSTATITRSPAPAAPIQSAPAQPVQPPAKPEAPKPLQPAPAEPVVDTRPVVDQIKSKGLPLEVPVDQVPQQLELLMKDLAPLLQVSESDIRLDPKPAFDRLKQTWHVVAKIGTKQSIVLDLKADTKNGFEISKKEFHGFGFLQDRGYPALVNRATILLALNNKLKEIANVTKFTIKPEDGTVVLSGDTQKRPPAKSGLIGTAGAQGMENWSWKYIYRYQPEFARTGVPPQYVVEGVGRWIRDINPFQTRSERDGRKILESSILKSEATEPPEVTARRLALASRLTRYGMDNARLLSRVMTEKIWRIEMVEQLMDHLDEKLGVGSTDTVEIAAVDFGTIHGYVRTHLFPEKNYSPYTFLAVDGFLKDSVKNWKIRRSRVRSALFGTAKHTVYPMQQSGLPSRPSETLRTVAADVVHQKPDAYFAQLLDAMRRDTRVGDRETDDTLSAYLYEALEGNTVSHPEFPTMQDKLRGQFIERYADPEVPKLAALLMTFEKSGKVQPMQWQFYSNRPYDGFDPYHFVDFDAYLVGQAVFLAQKLGIQAVGTVEGRMFGNPATATMHIKLETTAFTAAGTLTHTVTVSPFTPELQPQEPTQEKPSVLRQMRDKWQAYVDRQARACGVAQSPGPGVSPGSGCSRVMQWLFTVGVARPTRAVDEMLRVLSIDGRQIRRIPNQGSAIFDFYLTRVTDRLFQKNLVPFSLPSDTEIYENNQIVSEERRREIFRQYQGHGTLPVFRSWTLPRLAAAGYTMVSFDVTGTRSANNVSSDIVGNYYLFLLNEAIQKELGPGFLIVRTGGDEFAVASKKTIDESVAKRIEEAAARVNGLFREGERIVFKNGGIHNVHIFSDQERADLTKGLKLSSGQLNQLLPKFHPEVGAYISAMMSFYRGDAQKIQDALRLFSDMLFDPVLFEKTYELQTKGVHVDEFIDGTDFVAHRGAGKFRLVRTSILGAVKRVNDTRGKEKGDELLNAIFEQITLSLQKDLPNIHIVRTGTDVLIESPDDDAIAQQIEASIQDAVSKIPSTIPLFVVTSQVPVTFVGNKTADEAALDAAFEQLDPLIWETSMAFLKDRFSGSPSEADWEHLAYYLDPASDRGLNYLTRMRTTRVSDLKAARGDIPKTRAILLQILNEYRPAPQTPQGVALQMAPEQQTLLETFADQLEKWAQKLESLCRRGYVPSALTGIFLEKGDVHEKEDHDKQQVSNAGDINNVSNIHGFSETQNAIANATIPKAKFLVNHNQSPSDESLVIPGRMSTTPNQPAARLVNKPERIPLFLNVRNLAMQSFSSPALALALGSWVSHESDKYPKQHEEYRKQQIGDGEGSIHDDPFFANTRLNSQLPSVAKAPTSITSQLGLSTEVNSGAITPTANTTFPALSKMFDNRASWPEVSTGSWNTYTIPESSIRYNSSAFPFIRQAFAAGPGEVPSGPQLACSARSVLAQILRATANGIRGVEDSVFHEDFLNEVEVVMERTNRFLSHWLADFRLAFPAILKEKFGGGYVTLTEIEKERFDWWENSSGDLRDGTYEFFTEKDVRDMINRKYNPSFVKRLITRRAPKNSKDLIEIYNTSPQALRIGLSGWSSRAHMIATVARGVLRHPALVELWETQGTGYTQGITDFYEETWAKSPQEKDTLDAFMTIMAPFAKRNGFSTNILEDLWNLYLTNPVEAEVYMRLTPDPNMRLGYSNTLLLEFIDPLRKGSFSHIPWDTVLSRLRTGEQVTIADLQRLQRTLDPQYRFAPLINDALTAGIKLHTISYFPDVLNNEDYTRRNFEDMFFSIWRSRAMITGAPVIYYPGHFSEWGTSAFRIVVKDPNMYKLMSDNRDSEYWRLLSETKSEEHVLFYLSQPNLAKLRLDLEKGRTIFEDTDHEVALDVARRFLSSSIRTVYNKNPEEYEAQLTQFITKEIGPYLPLELRESLNLLSEAGTKPWLFAIRTLQPGRIPVTLRDLVVTVYQSPYFTRENRRREEVDELLLDAVLNRDPTYVAQILRDKEISFEFKGDILNSWILRESEEWEGHAQILPVAGDILSNTAVPLVLRAHAMKYIVSQEAVNENMVSSIVEILESEEADNFSIPMIGSLASVRGNFVVPIVQALFSEMREDSSHRNTSLFDGGIDLLVANIRNISPENFTSLAHVVRKAGEDFMIRYVQKLNEEYTHAPDEKTRGEVGERIAATISKEYRDIVENENFMKVDFIDIIHVLFGDSGEREQQLLRKAYTLYLNSEFSPSWLPEQFHRQVAQFALEQVNIVERPDVVDEYVRVLQSETLREYIGENPQERGRALTDVLSTLNNLWHIESLNEIFVIFDVIAKAPEIALHPQFPVYMARWREQNKDAVSGADFEKQRTPLGDGIISGMQTIIAKAQDVPSWLTDADKESVLAFLFRNPELVDSTLYLLNSPRITELVSARPEVQRALFNRIFIDNTENFQTLSQLVEAPNTTQGELLRSIIGAASREFLQDPNATFRAVINVNDPTQGIALGRTFNTNHATIVRTIGGNATDYIAVIVQDGQLGIDRVDNRGMTPQERREMAAYAVRVLLQEGANSNWQFFFRDQRTEASYTLAEIAAGKLDEIINPYAVIAEDSLDKPITFTSDAPANTQSGYIYLTRGRDSLTIVIPNSQFMGTKTFAAGLLRLEYPASTQVSMQIGTAPIQQIMLGELAGTASDFSYVVGDKFTRNIDGGTEDLLVGVVTPERFVLVQPDGNRFVMTRVELNAQIQTGAYQFFIPAPTITYRTISVGKDRPSLQLAEVTRNPAYRKAFIGATTRDGRFIWTTETQAHNQLLQKAGLVEPEIGVKVVYGINGIWTIGGSLEGVQTLMQFVQNQSLQDLTSFDISIPDSPALHFAGSLKQMHIERPQFFRAPELEVSQETPSPNAVFAFNPQFMQIVQMMERVGQNVKKFFQSEGTSEAEEIREELNDIHDSCPLVENPFVSPVYAADGSVQKGGCLGAIGKILKRPPWKVLRIVVGEEKITTVTNTFALVFSSMINFLLFGAEVIVRDKTFFARNSTENSLLGWIDLHIGDAGDVLLWSGIGRLLLEPVARIFTKVSGLKIPSLILNTLPSLVVSIGVALLDPGIRSGKDLADLFGVFLGGGLSLSALFLLDGLYKSARVNNFVQSRLKISLTGLLILSLLTIGLIWAIWQVFFGVHLTIEQFLR